MAEFTIEKVCQAINAFNQGQAQTVDAYLRAFSQSSEAWPICIQILLSNPDTQYHFQLLRVLKSKILYDFISLKQHEVNEIQEKCLQIVRLYCGSNTKSIRIQCVLIFIYLYLYTYTPQTKSILEVLVHQYDQKFFYDVIETLPEELVDNKNIIIDDEKKKLICQDIKNKQMLEIITYLQQQWLNAQEDTSKYHILRAYKKWLTFMKTNIEEHEAIQFIQLSGQTVLFKATLESIGNEELQAKATEAICTFVSLIPKSISDSPNLEPQVIQILFDEIYKTFKLCKTALEEELSDEIHNLIKMYAKIGKKFMHKILLNKHLEQYLQTMLWIFQHENSFYEQEILMDFWIKMIKAIRMMNDVTIQSNFGLTFQSIINGCVKNSKVSKILLTEYGISPKIEDEFESLLETRSQMKEIIEELVTIIQPFEIIQHLGGILKTEFISKMDEQGWIIFEACMNLISGIIKQIILKNDQVAVQYLMEIIKLYLDVIQSQQLANNNFIMKTVFRTISKGCAQLITSAQLLPSLFNFITIGINHPVSGVQKKAAKAFQLICQQNQSFVLLHLGQFLDLIVKLQQVENYDNLIKGVANAICSSQETMQQYYIKLCSIFAQNLIVIQKEFEEKQIESVIKQYCKNVSSLAYINSQITADETEQGLQIRILIVNVYQELWPVLKYGVERIATLDHGVAERIVRYTKHTFRKAFNQFSVELLAQVFQCFLGVYRQQPITACIYIAEVSATVFYKYSEYRSILQEVFENLCNITFQHLPQLSSFEENPDLTEDFFGMLVRFGRYIPVLLLQSQALNTIIQLTLMAVGLEHVSAAKAFYSWLEVALKIPQPQDEVFKTQIPQEYKDKFQQILLPYIPQYMSKLFEALRKGPTDEEVEDYIEDCIQAIQQLQFIDYRKLLEVALDEGPQNILTQSEKRSWIDCLDSEKHLNFLKLYTRRCLQNKIRG